MPKKTIVSIICLFLFFHGAAAQVEGLWLVKKVMVGNKDRTPVARWFRLSDGKQTSGNGWLTHSFGTYHWDKKLSSLKFKTDNEPEDMPDTPPFEVVRKGKTMKWSRLEDGMPVTVELEVITELPMGPADRVKGLWHLEKLGQNEAGIITEYNPENDQFIFIRWDRVFVRKIDASRQLKGYWVMDGHKPELRLIGDAQHPDEVWLVSFHDSNITFTGTSENVKGLELSFQRMNIFPR